MYESSRNAPTKLSISSKSQMIFDATGRECETRYYHYNSLREIKRVFRYSEYDKCGNWLLRMSEEGDATPRLLTRTIEYY